MSPQVFRNRDLETRYQIDGEGPVVVFIHGIGQNLECWDTVLGALGPGFRVLRYDLRGFGQSSRVRGRYELGSYVEDLAALLHHLGIDRCTLVGFSIGGIIAQSFALTYPDIVERMVLSSTIAGVDADDRDYLQSRYRGLKEGVPRDHFRRSLSNYFTPEFVAANPALIAQLEAEANANDPQIFTQAYRIIAETDMIHDLDAIRARTLVMTGEDDRASPRMAKAIADAIAGAELVVLPGLRHNLMHEAPGLMAATIRRFLDNRA